LREGLDNLKVKKLKMKNQTSRQQQDLGLCLADFFSIIYVINGG